MKTMPDYNKRLIKRLQEERKEAREAARWLYKAWSRSEDDPVSPEEYEGPVEERWPWLLSQQ